jgi:hypothetical protein
LQTIGWKIDISSLAVQTQLKFAKGKHKNQMHHSHHITSMQISIICSPPYVFKQLEARELVVTKPNDSGVGEDEDEVKVTTSTRRGVSGLISPHLVQPC